MRQSMRFNAVIVVMLGLATTFAPASAGSLALKPGSKLWLDGKSNIHEYMSTTTSLQVTFEENAAAWPEGASGGAAIDQFIRATGVRSIDVVVPILSLHSGKAGLDKNMYKAMQAPKYPDIRFKMATYDVAAGTTAAEMVIDAKGTLTIDGVQRDIRLKVNAAREGDVIRLRGDAPLVMSQYGIKPPTMMMGAMRVADEVVVHFDLRIGTAAASVVE